MRVLTHGLSDQPSGRGKSERAGKVWEGHSGWRVWAQLLRVWRVPKCVLAVRLSTLSSNGFRVKGRTSKAEQRRAHRRGNCFSGGAFGYPRAAESRRVQKNRRVPPCFFHPPFRPSSPDSEVWLLGFSGTATGRRRAPGPNTKEKTTRILVQATVHSRPSPRRAALFSATPPVRRRAPPCIGSLHTRRKSVATVGSLVRRSGLARHSLAHHTSSTKRLPHSSPKHRGRMACARSSTCRDDAAMTP